MPHRRKQVHMSGHEDLMTDDDHPRLAARNQQQDQDQNQQQHDFSSNQHELNFGSDQKQEGDEHHEHQTESASILGSVINPVSDTVSSIVGKACEVGEACTNKLGEVYEGAKDSVSSRICD